MAILWTSVVQLVTLQAAEETAKEEMEVEAVRISSNVKGIMFMVNVLYVSK